jgi:ABC-type bacteriocin/lantibiotic exporter with double-glycine peptidase domain
MPKKSSKPRFNFNQPQFMQISESHCGPAVIQMILNHLGIDVTQEEVAEMGGAASLIELNGMRVDQLALAVKKLAPTVDFWYKENSTLQELVNLIVVHRYPVGVEWQGLFDDPDDDDDDRETGDDEYGHYSVVTHVHPRKRQLIIADPYKSFISQARVFNFEEFVERWYDYNEVAVPETGKTQLVEDFHMMFIITPPGEVFPYKYGMKRAYDPE